MKKYFLLLIFLLPICVKAECSDFDTSLLRSKAANINYMYKYNESDKTATFDITFSSDYFSLSLKDTNNNKFYDLDGEITIRNLKPNNVYTYEIYSRGLGCTSEALRTIVVKTPGYNIYYKDPLCKGIEDYKYCDKWINVSLSYDQFKKNVTKYRESLKEETKEEKIKVNNFKEILNKLVKIYKDYYYIPLILIILFTLIKIKKENDKSKLE